MWDQGSEWWDLGSQTMGSGAAVFLGTRDQAVQYLWDQGRKLFITLWLFVGKQSTQRGDFHSLLLFR